MSVDDGLLVNKTPIRYLYNVRCLHLFFSRKDHLHFYLHKEDHFPLFLRNKSFLLIIDMS